MNETVIHFLAYTGGISLACLFFVFVVWLFNWIPSRASKDYVYEKTSAVQKEASDWYTRLSHRITALERNAKDDK